MKNFGKLLLLASLVILSPIAVGAEVEISEAARQAMKNGIDAVDRAASTEDLDQAVNFFEEALAGAPGWPDARYNLASVLAMKTGREEDALEQFRRYLEMFPQSADEADVLAEIASLEARLQLLRSQEQIGRYLNFAALPSGIYVMNTPSRMGFHRNDRIVTINGTSTQGMTLAEFYKIMGEGPRDEFVCFEYVRRGGVTSTYGYKRENLYDIKAPNTMSGGQKNQHGGYVSCIGGNRCCGF